MDSSPRSSRVEEPTLPTISGVKRPASLLPAFEPLSSSPGLPRPVKRQATGNGAYKYPTPVPTSSTGILSSSPPRLAGRPNGQRSVSAATERAPLSAVPTVELNEKGEALLMGRSSNSSHYQLSANRLISRVHVKARYIPAASPPGENKIEIVCSGWNGLKVHCQGRTWELAKGDTFTSETESADIMVDVQDARVLIQWPKRADSLGNLSDSSWEDSPTRPRADRNGAGSLQSSPLRRQRRMVSPESPTQKFATSLDSLSALSNDRIQIYEDPNSGDELELPKLPSEDANASFMTEATNKSYSSDLSDPEDDDLENDPNEENDPIVHSFGPFGANLSDRMASIFAGSPTKASRPSPHAARRPLANSKGTTGVTAAAGALSTAIVFTGSARKTHRASSPIPAQARASSKRTDSTTPAPSSSRGTPAPAAEPSFDLSAFDVPTITNHVVNQLAYSRLQSTPLSAILSHLPADAKADGKLGKNALRHIIEDKIACVGTILRQGKDAAGKPLESEYYYMPEKDEDEFRRLAVTDGMRKPSLRACRKQHKVRLDSLKPMSALHLPQSHANFSI